MKTAHWKIMLIVEKNENCTLEDHVDSIATRAEYRRMKTVHWKIMLIA
jgi:hypothetical protein